MNLLEDEAIIKINPIENINVFWCYLVLGISSELPDILKDNLIGYLLLIIAVAFLLKKYFKNRYIKLAYIFGEPHFRLKSIIGILILAILTHIVFSSALVYVFSYIDPSKLLSYYTKTNTYSLTKSSFVNLVIVVPVLEELFYRGVLLNRLKGSSLNKRLIVSSIIFGLVHLEWIIVAGILGYILGYVYLKSRSLITPIILHSTLNLIVFIGRFYESNQVESIELIRSETFYLFLASLVLSPLYIYLFMKYWNDVKSFKEVPYIKNMLKKKVK